MRKVRFKPADVFRHLSWTVSNVIVAPVGNPPWVLPVFWFDGIVQSDTMCHVDLLVQLPVDHHDGAGHLLDPINIWEDVQAGECAAGRKDSHSRGKGRVEH